MIISEIAKSSDESVSSWITAQELPDQDLLNQSEAENSG